MHDEDLLPHVPVQFLWWDQVMWIPSTSCGSCLILLILPGPFGEAVKDGIWLLLDEANLAQVRGDGSRGQGRRLEEWDCAQDGMACERDGIARRPDGV